MLSAAEYTEIQVIEVPESFGDAGSIAGGENDANRNHHLVPYAITDRDL